MKECKKTTVKLEQYSSDGEYCLVIPDEIVDKFMWREGTDIVMSVEDGKIIIKNKENEQ
jgi:bifunctional DNA-binding transcriptional regulator/antitoxin component of YhaV-PrlF toxin-antitoxin module